MITTSQFLALASKGFAVGAAFGLGMAILRYLRRAFSLVFTGSYRSLG